MSNRQAVVLASRVLCFYLLYNAFANLTHFPAYILDLGHHWHSLSTGLTPAYDKYWLRYDSLELDEAVLRLALEIFFASVFYRCGGRISRFLLGVESEPLTPESES
ncbi:MAG TPA: hypothetical protein VIJ65_02850 [Acidobacteriaceae bacterium]